MMRMQSAVLLAMAAGCGATESQLRTRAAFDFNCPAESIQVFELDSRSRGVDACGQHATYVESCVPQGFGAQECTWVLNSDSRPTQPKAAPSN